MNFRSSKTPAEQLVEVMTRIYNLHLTTPSGGNVSILDENGVLWVTPSQIDKGRLEPADIIKIFPDGTIRGRHKPTMEYRFHQEIYHSRPDIRAVAHAHPPGLVAFSIVIQHFAFDHIPSLIMDCQPVVFSKYAIPGSAELGENISDAFTGGSHAVFMENHGIITTGKTLREAFHRIENLETFASIYIDSLRLGEITNLSAEELKAARVFKNVQCPDDRKHFITGHEHKICKDLVEIVKRTYERKLVTAVSGGFSARVDETGFFITPEGLDIKDMEPNDLVFIKKGKHEIGKTPSQFTSLHDEIYRKHKFIHSISSAHPISVMAFAITGTPLDSHTIPESFLMLNDIPLVPFRKRIEHPEEIADLITPCIPGVLIRNDCLTVTGTSPFQVFDRLEVAEFTARSILNAKPIGLIKPISDQDIDDLKKKFS
jgi:L-fuculose-phosphate aldolase